MTKQTQEAYIVAATRTPVGKAPRGMFKHVRPDDMLVHVLQAVMKQCEGLDAAAIEDVIVGCAMPEAEQGINVARVALLLAGFPNNVPGMTINRFCASGLQSVALAADRIRLGEADVMIAAGTESMSMVPMMGNKVSMNPAMFEHEENVAIAYGMGMTAEKVAEQWHVSREDQDEFALTSHQRAMKAIETGEFKQEITPYPVDEKHPDLAAHAVREEIVVKGTDEGPRADTSLEVLAKLKPVFAAKGSVTAGNSSQMSDGAGAVVLMSEAAMKRYNLSPLGRFIGYSVIGVPPEIMGVGPIKAIPKVLAQTGIKQNDLDWIELNEAFAAQSLAVIRDLGLDRAKVNPLGGAIALGHPLGATGSIRVATLLHGLRRHHQKYGMVTMCVGSGMGAAGVFEAL
ncbi:acetyl-CoA C-acyltransferase [Nitrosomonas sp. JL21]|uniref:acetyl-CoA C-acyltransferase n=1 Tax=Nitrosomonas sp. JL21 TaxID=153949 RepID=UPI00136E394D|nr:acetyl-CoA C-acyltransferase [Nitrosomonas sp. JL21]MBL8498361.1 acetyl-CoA C-acyltransferase [Nitrosomonas sp.]MCC7091816.1 acetyl-CoA C-acyltransferase [Nitrosomonas sp.]MXS77576.1 acetyl-CoA C-acyltransferase [Nitrosomonas sp. JL21]